jgi:hypothetical protein
MKQESARECVERTRREQGLGPYVTDRAFLDSLASAIAQNERRKRREKREKAKAA